MMPRRTVRIVHNALAGRRSTNVLVRAVAHRLLSLGHDLSLEYTLRPGHAVEIAARAASERIDVVLAAGGDGTVREVAEGLAGSETALGVIPIGTVNLWATEMGIVRNARALASMAAIGAYRHADMGIANGHSFLLMASTGFDAAAVQCVGIAAKRALGRYAYAASAARLMPRYRGVRTRMTIDGALNEVRALLILLGNTRRYGGRLLASPDALVDDGMLEIAVIQGDRAWHGLSQVGSMISSFRSGYPTIARFRARCIDIEPETPLPIQVDGDFIGYTPMQVTVRPSIVRVLVGGCCVPEIFSARGSNQQTGGRSGATIGSSTELLPNAEKGHACV